MIHVPTFSQIYEGFWEMRGNVDASITASMSFVTLMIAVCYAGSVANPDRATSSSESRSKQITNHLHELGMQGLDLTLFPQVPTIETLTAYLILHTTCKREEEPLVRCMAVLLI